jgi:fatty-acyl-CoA synthase
VPVDAQLALQPDASRYTLPALIADLAARHGEREALRFETASTSYAELHATARSWAKGLVELGVVKGARVALLMPNRPEWVAAAFAVSMTGGVLVPVNTYATPEERDYILRHGDASMLLLQPSLLKHRFLDDFLADHLEIAEGVPGRIRCESLPSLRAVVSLGSDAPGAVQPWSVLSCGQSVSDAHLDALAAEVTPSDDALIIYTSGTTARPKGVLHRQRAPVIQSWRFAELMGLAPDDRVYTAQPFFWTAGIAMSLGATLAAGATLLIDETFDPARALACIERERATTVHAWPHQEKSMAEHPDADRRDLSRLRHVEFGNPLARKIPLAADVWGMYGSYGLSETFTLATALSASAPPEARHATNGPPLPGNTVRIVDPESGQPLPTGEKGEIAVQGLTFMSGYVKVDPENYLDADGFFHTQDGGWLDDDGMLHWKGRLSNLIKTGGANVSPLEIEAALADYPGVKTCHAIGVPHPTLGEVVVLCAVPVDASTAIAPEAVRAWLAVRIASYKVPRVVLAFAPEEVAYTGTQKVQLDPLREKALARLAAGTVEIAGHRY